MISPRCYCGQIDVLKLPLDNLREATAFRMREMQILGEKLHQMRLSDNCSTASTCQSDLITCGSSGHMSSGVRTSIFAEGDEVAERKKAMAEHTLYQHLSR